MSLPRIDIVILNYNTRNILAQCLPQVLEYSQHENVRIILADNASTDDSVNYVKNEFGNQIQIIQLDKNYGFAGGYNQALKQCDAEYFVLLNSDAEPGNADWLHELVKTAESHPDFAAAQPKILDYKRNGKFEYAGAAGGCIDTFGFPFCKGRIFGNVETDKGQYDESTPIFWASGAALFIRRDAWEKVNGLDPDFFAHMEEIDLCWRIQSENLGIYSCPQATVYHMGGATLSNQNPRKTFLNFRNSLIMLHKNLPESILKKRILQRKLFDGLAGIFFLIQGKPKHTLQIIKAHGEYDKLKANLTKSPKPTNPITLKGMFAESLVFSYFFKGKKTFADYLERG